MQVADTSDVLSPAGSEGARALSSRGGQARLELVSVAPGATAFPTRDQPLRLPLRSRPRVVRTPREKGGRDETDDPAPLEAPRGTTRASERGASDAGGALAADALAGNLW